MVATASCPYVCGMCVCVCAPRDPMCPTCASWCPKYACPLDQVVGGKHVSPDNDDNITWHQGHHQSPLIQKCGILCVSEWHVCVCSC